jgi:hypothetical protein
MMVDEKEGSMLTLIILTETRKIKCTEEYFHGYRIRPGPCLTRPSSL